jgi:hypothetical protein
MNTDLITSQKAKRVSFKSEWRKGPICKWDFGHPTNLLRIEAQNFADWEEFGKAEILSFLIGDMEWLALSPTKLYDLCVATLLVPLHLQLVRPGTVVRLELQGFGGEVRFVGEQQIS